MSTSSVTEVINNTNSNNSLNSKRINSYITVKQLVNQYLDLINETHEGWFAKRFYTLPEAEIHELANKARTMANKPRHYFSKGISEMYKKAGATNRGKRTSG